MHFQIEKGTPEFEALYADFETRAEAGALDKDEARFFKKLSKTISFLENDPRHPGLQSHQIDELSARYSKQIGKDIKVWQSYLENQTPAAGRLYWIYGPLKEVITLIGLEPHPEDEKKSGYAKVRLSFPRPH